MEYSVEELKNALIERCEKEGILYATVAMDRRTKEMILPDTLEGALKHPEYFCMYLQESERSIYSGGDYQSVILLQSLFLFFFFIRPILPANRRKEQRKAFLLQLC